MEPHGQFEAALTKLDEDHEKRQAEFIAIVPPQLMMNGIRELNRLRTATLEAMRAYYFEPATEPNRVVIYPNQGDNGSATE